MSRKPLIASAAALLLPVILLGCGAGDPPAAKQSPTAMSKSDSASPATSAPAKTPVSSVTVTGAANASGLPPLAIEDTGRVATLPASYPESWMMVDEVSFFSMFGGKIIVLDIAETNPAKRIKGLMDKSLMGNFTQSKLRSELYIMESFHERGSRGPLTDVLVIYDKTTLAIVKELVWPVPKRLGALPERYAMAVSKDERHLYVSNFNPAASFTVIDLESREIVGEIGTPGCVLTYPTGNRSVSSLCSNGGMLTTVLKDDGTLKSQHRLAPFFDTDDTPIFERPAIINGIAYFPSFKGKMHNIDMSGDVAKYIGSWSLLSEQERADNIRPSGLVLNDKDDQGLFYVIMQEDGKEGTQTHGGGQVWVFDPVKKQRLRVIDMPSHALSITVTRGKNPMLVVTNGEMNLDIFNANDGSFIQTVSDFGNVTPLLVHKSY
jgi:methylamine dehydrogenase heavy chain